MRAGMQHAQVLYSKTGLACCLSVAVFSQSSHHEPKLEDSEVKSAGWKDKKGDANRRRCGEDRSRRSFASWYVTSDCVLVVSSNLQI